MRRFILSKMLTEEIYLHCLRVILSTILLCLFYFIKNYLDKKPLGMQTILDTVLKDLLIILITNVSLSHFGFVSHTYINQTFRHYIALIIIGFWNLFRNAFLINSIIWVLLRYFYVFHQTILNLFDDSKIIKCSRVFTWIFCITLTAFEVPYMIYEPEYSHMMDQKWDSKKYTLINKKIKVILFIVGLIITIFVQTRIEGFKKTVDFKIESNQAENGNAENNLDFVMDNSLRYVVMGLFLLIIVSIDWIMRSMEAENVFLSGLRKFVIGQFVLCVISVILVKRNPKMYTFCVNKCYFVYPRK